MAKDLHATKWGTIDTRVTDAYIFFGCGSERMATTPFGEHLKRERELRGVSLDEIAAATRIKTSFLEALENGRWNELPGGAFNRGFVRATARFLGLDEDGMVAEFAIETNGGSQVKAPAEPSGAMPRNYRPALVAISALVVLLIAAGWFIHHKIAVHRQQRAAATAVAASIPVNSAATTSASASNAGKTEAGASTPPNANVNQPPATPATAATITPTPAGATAPEPLKLRLETSKTTEIRVMGDDKLMFKGRLHSDDPKHFEARNGFEVSSNDAGAVKLQLNDESVPFRGMSGRRGSVSLSRKDLKGAAEPTH